MEYNTTRSNLILREYGRNFHKLVNYVKEIKEKEKRNKLSHTLIKMMKVTHPNFNDQNEVEAKLWDDLFIMAEYDMDIESPYPKPVPQTRSEKPKALNYPKNKIKYRHYGKKIELLIDEACKLKKDEDKESAIIHIGKIMKSFFSMWNKESIDNNVIVENIKELSNNKLSIDIEKVKKLNLFYKVTKERGSRNYHSKNHSKRNNKPNRPFRKRRMQ
tara:strand:+ start:646 stop:1293 length:648 start_codon:yes stop_codon:yes gene_type:complete